MTEPREVCRVLASGRVSLSNEKEAQAGLDALLVAAFGRDAVRREVRLTTRDVPDFMIGRTVVEVKVKGGAAAIFRQLERYAEHPDVDAIVLATGRAMGLPSVIGDKSAYYVSLGRGWL